MSTRLRYNRPKMVDTSPVLSDRRIYNQLEYWDPVSYKFVSRYSTTRTVEKDGERVHESVYELDIAESNGDKYYTVTAATENRLDLISSIFYSFPIYWWIIAAANDIIDSFTVSRGTVLRIPPISTLYVNKGLFASDHIMPLGINVERK